MLKKRELVLIIISTIIIGFLVSLGKGIEAILWSSFSIFIILLINSLAKKIAAFSLDSEIDIDLWEIQRYGFQPHKYFKKPFPAGILFPIISKIILFPFQNFVWMASLVFDSKPLVYRSAKRFGLYTFSEMTEYHTGLIAAAGITANLIFTIIAYLIGFPAEMNFIQLTIIFTFFNILPISNLDGNKIFFGSLLIWALLSTIILLSLISMIIII